MIVVDACLTTQQTMRVYHVVKIAFKTKVQESVANGDAILHHHEIYCSPQQSDDVIFIVHSNISYIRKDRPTTSTK